MKKLPAFIQTAVVLLGALGPLRAGETASLEPILAHMARPAFKSSFVEVTKAMRQGDEPTQTLNSLHWISRLGESSVAAPEQAALREACKLTLGLLAHPETLKTHADQLSDILGRDRVETMATIADAAARSPGLAASLEKIRAEIDFSNAASIEAMAQNMGSLFDRVGVHPESAATPVQAAASPGSNPAALAPADHGQVTAQNLPGTYVLKVATPEGMNFKIKHVINADGTLTTQSGFLGRIDSVSSGRWTLEDGKFVAHNDVGDEFGQEQVEEIDLGAASRAALKQGDGVLVTVKSSQGKASVAHLFYMKDETPAVPEQKAPAVPAPR